MKLSFSTLGCPKLSFRDVLSIAKDLGYDGIELRGIMQTIDAPDLKEFSAENCQQTMERLKKLGLEIPILTSACKLHREDKWETTLALAKRYVDTAAKIGTKYVRMLGDSYPAPGGHVSDEVVLAHLAEIADYAAEQGVTILLETNGVYADTARLRRLITDAGRENIAVIWDINHPAQFFGETPEQTYANIGDLVRHVHVKDSVKAFEKFDKVQYHMIGHGDVPVKQAIELLLEKGYEGYFSLEWVKRWDFTLEEPGIVFAHYANYMRKLEK